VLRVVLSECRIFNNTVQQDPTTYLYENSTVSFICNFSNSDMCTVLNIYWTLNGHSVTGNSRVTTSTTTDVLSSSRITFSPVIVRDSGRFL